ARLDLRLAPERLGLALGVLEQLPTDPARLADAGGAEDLDREQRERHACGDADGDSDPDQHLAPPGSLGLAAASGPSHPAPAGPSDLPKSLVGAYARRPARRGRRPGGPEALLAAPAVRRAPGGTGRGGAARGPLRRAPGSAGAHGRASAPSRGRGYGRRPDRPGRRRRPARGARGPRRARSRPVPAAARAAR